MRRVSDLLKSEILAIEVDICRNSGRIWTDRNTANAVGRFNLDSRKFDWDESSLSISEIMLTDAEKAQVNIAAASR